MKAKTSKLRFFPEKAQDIRVCRSHHGKMIQARRNDVYTVSFLPKPILRFISTGSSMDHGYSAKITETEVCFCALLFHFLFWTITIFEVRYKREYKEPWLEDHERHYIETVSDYIRKQKH